MTFWASETLERRAYSESLVVPFDQKRVKHSAYELGLGRQLFLTSDRPAVRKILEDGEQLVIPPGQFALLISQEKVTVPLDALGFISIKAGIKFMGLVNISGFHVDPGFSGHLKFSVYNAGGKEIILEPGAPTFLLWFACLDVKTKDGYNGSHKNQDAITSSDVMKLQGEIPSPAALDKRIKEIEFYIKVATKLAIIIFGVLLSVSIGFYIKNNLHQEGLQSPSDHRDKTYGTNIPSPGNSEEKTTPQVNNTIIVEQPNEKQKR